MSKTAKVLCGLLAVLVVLACVALVIGFQVGLIALGAGLAYIVAGWFGWFTAVGYQTYFIVGVLAWCALIVVRLPHSVVKASTRS
ncbi:hypothetical protein [Glutamicibacter creatinolyticus]|uniref:hypothetical protein n=1 Tax=Glutamicibacter creatinolyticus TaxID=162496 RepID=UPI003217714D